MIKTNILIAAAILLLFLIIFAFLYWKARKRALKGIREWKDEAAIAVDSYLTNLHNLLNGEAKNSESLIQDILQSIGSIQALRSEITKAHLRFSFLIIKDPTESLPLEAEIDDISKLICNEEYRFSVMQGILRTRVLDVSPRNLED